MSEILKYAVILPKSSHIKHTFGSYEQAETWMHNAGCTGFIAVLVGEVVNRTDTTAKSKEVVEFVKRLEGRME